MDERLKFVAECEAGDERMTKICLCYQVSRKTGYKWLARWRSMGSPADLSRAAPGAQPTPCAANCAGRRPAHRRCPARREAFGGAPARAEQNILPPALKLERESAGGKMYKRAVSGSVQFI
jgi:hypothetical protein